MGLYSCTCALQHPKSSYPHLRSNISKPTECLRGWTARQGDGDLQPNMLAVRWSSFSTVSGDLHPESPGVRDLQNDMLCHLLSLGHPFVTGAYLRLLSLVYQGFQSLSLRVMPPSLGEVHSASGDENR